MDLQRLPFFCLCVFSALVSVRAQGCDMVVATDLGTPQNSTDGFIALLLGGGDAATRPMVSVQNVEVVSLTVSNVQDMFQWASVIAEYTCTGQQCQISGGGDTVTRTEQFELQCVNSAWTDSNILANQRSTPENPSLTTADLRKDCSICVSPEDATLNSIPNPVDSEFHCAACDPSCLSGDDGLGYCTTIQASGCCNFYQPMDGVNTCALSCDAGYEPDSSFICERRCPELPDPTSGMVSDESRTVDSVATYTCDDRFRICEGTQNRTCRNDSTWDGEAVVCSVCPTLLDPANGDVTTNGFCVGDTATYTCDDGYYVDGAETRTCVGTAWSSTDPTCALCSTKFPNCKECTSDVCTVCDEGFELDADTGECKEVIICDEGFELDADTGECKDPTAEEGSGGGGCGGACIGGIIGGLLGALLLASAVSAIIYGLYKYFNNPATKLKSSNTEGLNGVARDNPLYVDPEIVAAEVAEP